MKEKTFEELFYDRIGNFDTEHHELIEKWEFIKFLQQVREATIAECREAIRKEHKTYTPFETHYQLPLGEQLYNLNQLPTDRIKTEK